MRKILTKQERESALTGLPDWTYQANGDAINRVFKFPTFVDAFAFMTACALEAEKLDHHPEWSNVYNRVDVTLTTHSPKGLTELDIQLAKKMDKLA